MEKSKFETLKILMLLAMAFSSNCFADGDDMISLNPNTGNETVDKLSRQAAGISDPARRAQYLQGTHNLNQMEAELKNALGRIERTVTKMNEYSMKGQSGPLANELARLETDLHSYQTIQKFTQKYGSIQLKFKTSLRVLTYANGMRNIIIDYGDRKMTEKTILKEVYSKMAERGLLNPISNPGSTQEIQTFKPYNEAIRVPIANVRPASGRPQLCSDCTTGGLMGEVLR